MITRVISLTESNGVPTLASFPGAHHVSNQVDGHFTVYLPSNGKRHLHSLMLWRQSAGVYAVFGKQQIVKALDLEAKNLVAYCKDNTHLWRTYSCDGTDADGDFSDRIVTFVEQPPKTISKGKPYVVGEMSITAVRPTIGSDCGAISLVDRVAREVDEEDRANTIKDAIKGTQPKIK